MCDTPSTAMHLIIIGGWVALGCKSGAGGSASIQGSQASTISTTTVLRANRWKLNCTLCKPIGNYIYFKISVFLIIMSNIDIYSVDIAPKA